MSRELIFVTDDEIHILELIKYNLEANGYRVVTFESGEALLCEVKATTPDLLILDIMLPGLDGFELCRQLRQNQKTKTVPVIMLTAKNEEFDKVLGLELGADDYMTKPFSVRELLARVKAALRRVSVTSSSPQVETIRHDQIIMDLNRHEVLKDGKSIEMPLKEFELLKILLLNKGRVLSRDALLEEIWGYDYYGETRTVDVHIRYLRQKIEDDDSNPIYIETIRGIGYRFSDKESVV